MKSISSFDTIAATLVPRATIQAPVKVAKSIIAFGEYCFSPYANASAKINLPSASVFKISAVFPLYNFIISPGLYDSPPNMFSTEGTIPTMLIGSFNSEIDFIIPSTVQPPHLSNFISSIAFPGFNEIPPVSNVTAFPTKTMGFSFRGPLLCSKIINLDWFLLP